MSVEFLKSLPFDIAARVPLQLGRESIGSATAAIAELVKNSYDANAENVKITFAKDACPISIIQIEDDGDGMNLAALENVWLRIGTEHKVKNDRSIGKQRVLTGAKGLGRLGIDRLCRKLVLQTKTADMDHFIEMHIDWKKYDGQGATIANVTHKIYKTFNKQQNKYSDFLKDKKSGTRLILIGLKEKWTPARLGELHNELSLLVSPFSDVTDFSIDFQTSVAELNGKLSSEKYLDAAVWSASAELVADGKIIVTYTQPKTGNGPPPIETSWEAWLPERAALPLCGPLSLKFFYIPQPESDISPNFRKKEWRNFMKLHHGLRIYRDNFRVRPYGEPTGRGDWLDLGLRKAANPSGIRQGSWRIGPSQILGAIFISRIENSTLIDQANREGMVETDPFFDMRAFALKVVSTFEAIATDFARLEIAPTDDPIGESSAELAESLTKSRQAVADLSLEVEEGIDTREELKDKLKKVEEFVEAAAAASEKQREAYTKLEEALEREKDTLANLASLGILTVCFGHEAKEFCNIAAVTALNLKDDINAGKFMITPEAEKDVHNDIDVIISSTKFIKNFSSFSLGNVQKEKRKKGPVNIQIIVDRVFTVLSESLDRQNIVVDYIEFPDELYAVNGYEIDWESILINMISNSIWALSRTENRKIKVKALNLDGAVQLRFMDSGCGIEHGVEEHIFKPMFSTRRDEKGNTIGTGMGLSIVRNFIEEHAKGKIEVLPNGDLGGAEFILTIPMLDKT